MSEHYVDVLDRHLAKSPYTYMRRGMYPWYAYTIVDVGGFDVLQAPGLVVILNAYIQGSQENKGLGQAASRLRVEAFRDYQATVEPRCVMVARVARDNDKQAHILRKVGWEQLTPDLGM